MLKYGHADERERNFSFRVTKVWYRNDEINEKTGRRY